MNRRIDNSLAGTVNSERLREIGATIIGHSASSADPADISSLYELANSLGSSVRERTRELERATADPARSKVKLVQARDQAENARRRLRAAIESIHDGFVLFDANGRLVTCNKHYLDLWPSIADRIAPGIHLDEIGRLIVQNAAVVDGYVPADGWIPELLKQHESGVQTHIYALPDGRWLQIKELQTSDGDIVGIYTDITEVKVKDERELAKRTAILQATLDNLPQGVCVFDDQRRLVASNGRLLSMLGLSRPLESVALTYDGFTAWCESESPIDIAADELAWLADDMLETVAKSSLPDGRTLEIRRTAMPDGGMVFSFTDVTAHFNAQAALRHANDTLEQRVGERTAALEEANRRLQREIGERQIAEEALEDAKTAAEQANLLKTRFLAAASHDLLQPLNAARLFIAALTQRRLALPTRALVAQTNSALASVEDLLESLCEISMLDSGAIRPQKCSFRLSDLLDAMQTEFAPVAQLKSLEFKVFSSEQWVRSDPRLLRRIVQNFISNAIRYTRRGCVHVDMVVTGANVEILVRDTGPGIPPNRRTEIFEEFRRLGGEKQDHGMGLGLAIVQRASRMLGHQIILDSQLGSGSTFGVIVPLTDPAAIDGKASRTAPHFRKPLAGYRLLVIDNDTTILNGMSVLLAGWGCRPITVSNEAAAQKLLADGDVPDTIIADFHLDNGERGDAVVSHLRDAYKRPIPAIIITADRTADTRCKLARDGFVVLDKPVKPAQLRALLSSLLTQVRADAH